jgi:hypothetical protein
MRPSLALAALLFAAPAFAVPALELEVNGGVKGHNGPDTIGPTLGARVGIDLWDILTFSVRGMSLSKFDQPTQEFGLLLDARVHSPGRFQVNGGLGLGLAIATVSPGGDWLDASFTTVRPFPLLDVGVRLNLWKFFVGLNVGGWPFTPTWMGTLSVGISLFGD